MATATPFVEGETEPTLSDRGLPMSANHPRWDRLAELAMCQERSGS